MPDEAIPSLDPQPVQAPLHRFSHMAMATDFEFFIAGVPADYAQQVALEGYALLDQLEEELSRFISWSDIARLGEAPFEEWIPIGPAAWECLHLARQFHAATGGAFDVTLGPLLDWWRSAPPESPEAASFMADDGWRAARARSGMERLVLDETTPAVLIRAPQSDAAAPPFPPGLGLDLGAIGKGYAVDQVAALLRAWEVPAAVIHGGQSSALALGAPPGESAWRLALRDPLDHGRTLATVRLRDRSLSGSGLRLHGHHIIDPRSGAPTSGRPGTWALAPTAAASDAVSTAFMVMDEAEVEAFCAACTPVSGMFYLPEDGGMALHRFGDWDLAE